MTIELKLPPFSSRELNDFVALSRDVFGEANPGSLKWRLTKMPDASLAVAGDGHWIGFKAGYAATHKRYYSWLGGVTADARRSGIASKLMQAQHRWLCEETAYELVETHVMQANSAMIRLNLNFGFEITGMFSRFGAPNYIMQRVLDQNRSGNEET